LNRSSVIVTVKTAVFNTTPIRGGSVMFANRTCTLFGYAGAISSVHSDAPRRQSSRTPGKSGVPQLLV
jgi:hypothetical protein